MATASSFLSEDQFLCAICLDVFTEPVSIPCGHNFCKACIHKHWENKEQCQCPLCNEKFNQGLKLRVNTGFREVVEKFKEHYATADNNSLAKQGQVPCDCCLGNKFKASKTCLVCLASYCETHLEPHLRVAALRRHKLTNPVRNLEDQICKKHNRMLELFCMNDQTCVCVLCTEHHSHHTIPLEEALRDKRAQMGKKKVVVQKSKHRLGKKGQKPKEPVQTKRKGEDEAMSNCVALNQMQDHPMWWLPDSVPGNGTLSKWRFYLELVAEESDLGGVTEPMRGTKAFVPNPNNGNWVVRVGAVPNNKSQHIIPTHCFLVKKIKRVVVYVNYDNGSVSFYDADADIIAFHFTGFHFNEMVYLFYCPEDSWFNRLQEKAQNIKAWSQLPDTIFVFRCIGLFFVVVVFFAFCN
ncbi:E3 ubiquitin/ISG15 ligase TRIM25-like [Cyclopterus lumpus]|uniref:Uncharacterized protein n=1 Tax=Cyclopterus lumpus TaxID=8103 RepID=A0A8C2X5F9_CYCLU|nr:E3 ubiquitin/ISG15 ligase TRIM25-like [Cyclopterus lumpus]